MKKPESKKQPLIALTDTLATLKKYLSNIVRFPFRLIENPNAHIHWPAETRRIMKLMPRNGIFLTGIETSDPMVENKRRNQLKEAYDFETNYEERLKRIRNLGITWLRYGPPYSQVHLGKEQCDFTLMDKVAETCKQLGIEIIMDLLHFGLPDWLHQDNPNEPYFQNPHFPTEFANYVTTVARRYPHLRYFTLVNEPFVTANLSAKIGAWNEARLSKGTDDKHFVRAVANIARAAILGRRAIEQVWMEEKRTGEPIFVQNESFEVAIAEPNSNREAEANQFNTRRFSALDLIFGHYDETMRSYLLNQGLPVEEYEWYMRNGRSTNTILGIDHYPWCVYHLGAHNQTDVDPLKNYQLYELAKVYWNRYRLPLLHTEVNGVPELAVAICQKTYDMLYQLSIEGYPIVGMGWYGDEYQVGWQTLLRGNEEYPVGLHYKGEAQPVALLFQQLRTQGLKSNLQKISFLSLLPGLRRQTQL